MDNIKDKVKDAIGKKEDQKATPGNNVKRGADNAANSSESFPKLILKIWSC
jgi:hypothetical protein